MIPKLPEFLGAVAIMTIVPGPDTALVIQSAVRGGRRSGLATALGCALGLMTWAFVAALGLLSLLRLSATLVAGIQLVGAGYLLLLGARCIARGVSTVGRLCWRRSNVCKCFEVDQRDRRARGVHAASFLSMLLQGFAADLLNPKAGVFFTALLPKFLGPSDSEFVALGFGLTAATGALLGLAAYGLAANVVGEVLRRRWPAVALDITVGTVFLLFGLALLRQGPAPTRHAPQHAH